MHDGIDTDRVRPDPTAFVRLAKSGLTLRPGDEARRIATDTAQPWGRSIALRVRAETLLAAAAEPPGGDRQCPLLLVPTPATETPVRQLAGILAANGRPYAVLPDPAGSGRIRPTWPAEREFLRRHLGQR